jgi:FixJ family two-component response regulator
MMERTLLLVDDEENIISSLVRLLRRDGYRILRANSGQAGLELLEHNEVGVIVSDQRMPEMSGVEFLSRVKELYPDTVRIVLSGYTELDSVTDAINRGAIYKFLTKPWDDDLLRANIDEAFKRFEMVHENEQLHHELATANEALSRVNEELEQRVADKTREVVRNLGILQVSQEVLEHLPVAVVGIGDDGMIAIANKAATDLFGAGGTRPLLGEAAAASMPAELLPGSSNPACQACGTRTAYRLPDGSSGDFWCYPMGQSSESKGWVLVIDPERGATI